MRNALSISLLLIGGLLLLLACVPEVSQDDGIERAASLQPTDTVLPFIPTESFNSAIGRSEPTSAALVGEGDADETPELTVVFPTAQYVPIQLIAPDGHLLSVVFFGAAQRPAPNMLLLHDDGHDGDVWIPFAPQFQDAGYNVFVFDLPRNNGVVDATLALETVQLVVDHVLTMQGIAAPQFHIMGIGSGANVALNACVVMALCNDAIAISLRPETESITTANLNLSADAVLLMTADDDQSAVVATDRLVAALGSSAQWQRFSSGGRGIELLRQGETLVAQIVAWLQR